MGYDPLYAIKWTLFSFVFHLLAVIFVLYEVKHRVFSDIDVSKREQRPLFFGVVSIILVIYLVSLIFFQAPRVLYAIALGAIIGVVMAFVVNLRIKASLHIAVLTAVLIILIQLYTLPYLFFLLIPVVGWSRVTIKRHTIPEVIAGCLLGIGLTLVSYFLLKYIYIICLSCNV